MLLEDKNAVIYGAVGRSAARSAVPSLAREPRSFSPVVP
jgi:hypothetical protein